MAAFVPPAPELSSTLRWHVFLHHAAPGSGENRRLATYGQVMLDAAYSIALATTPRRRTANGHQMNRDGSIGGFASTWVENYGWRAEMRSVPPNIDLNSREETLQIFHAYVGAVASVYSYQGLVDWIKALIAA
ncbi:hypothetical protein C8Q76DRAFT_68886 [Earliella scabrosa]|nr:hypothetical protein C8Q76DRAFT_68886 [Earliella scabrosa]